MRAQFIIHEVWIGLRRNLTMTIALIVVVAISLSLLGTGLLFVKQVNETRTYWQGRVQLSVYLCNKVSQTPQCQKNGPVTPAEIAQIQQELVSNPAVAKVTYQSQAQS
jgi:cell division transport system permease protein